MTIDPNQLLRKLNPPVRPVGTDRARPGRAPIEQQSFGELLSLVADGTIASDRPITVADPDALTEPLTDAQLARLASAADQAEAAGARNAVMLMDGRGFVLDVHDRAVTSELGPAASSGVVPIDAAVYVPNDEELTTLATQQRTTGPGMGVLPSAVAEQILHHQERAAEAARAAADDDPPARAAG